jgi:hypothetical protein
MKFSNGTEFRFATPKYSHIWGRLLNIGGVLILLSFTVKDPTKGWIVDIASLLIFVGLMIALVGAVAERREWQAKRHDETK